MKTKKDILLKKINKYQKRHILIYRNYFMIFRRKMAVRYDNQNKNNLIFYDYYSKNDKFIINKEALKFTCRDFYDRIKTVLGKDYSNLEYCTFDILHISKSLAFVKFAEFLMNIEEYYELYNDNVDVAKLDRRKEFKDVYDIIDNIK